MTEFSAEAVTNLVSWPAAALALAYVVLCAVLYRRGVRKGGHVATAIAALIAATGFLLRPLSEFGLDEEARTALALALRTAFLVLMLGLVWAAVDHLRDAARRRRD